MTNKTISLDRELVSRIVGLRPDYTCAQLDADEELVRAALADPVPPAGGEPQVVGYMQDRSDGEPLITLESHQSYVAQLRSKIKDLCDHPSMSFHQIALLEGVLDYVPDGEPVDRAHVTQLQAEVERLKQTAPAEGLRSALTECIKQRDQYQSELTKARELLIPAECPHMIVFDDADRETLMFAGEGARTAALKTWEQISGSWNAHLFVRVERNSRDDRYPSANQSAPADKGQGEPVGLQHMAVAEDGKLRWMSGRKMQNCELYSLPDGSPIRFPLYAAQPAPVAVDDCDLKALMDRHEAWKAGEANGIASMVMPDRVTAQSHWPEWKISGSEGWNACLDEVVRLNSEPKP